MSSSHLLHQDSTTDKDSATKPTLPVLQISTDRSWSSGWAQGAVENMIMGSDGREQKEQQDENDNDEDSYFGVLDKYCNSDDDPTSPSTASPTSPFSGRKDFWAAQPPTPPVTSSSRRLDRHQQQQRDPFAVQSPSRRAAAPLRNTPAPAQSTDLTASTALLSPASSTTNSPMMTASAKFSNYLQSGAARGSRESFTLHDSPSSTNVGTNSTPRSYSKRPLPVPPSSTTTTTSPASNSFSTSESPSVSVASTSTRSSFLSLNHSTPDLREIRPEPPQKDTTRRMLGNAHNDTNTTTNNNNNSPYAGNKNNSSSTSHLPPMLGDTHLSDSLTSFSAVVEASMERRRNASVSSGGSSTLADINPYADNATAGAASLLSTPSNNSHGYHSNSNDSTGQGHSTSSSTSNKSSSRPSQLNYLTNGRSKDRAAGSNQQHLYHHQVQNNSVTSLSRGQHQSQSEDQSHYRQQQRHQHQHQQQSNSSRPYDGSSLPHYSSSSPALYSPSANGGGATPSEMLSNRLNSSRMRSHSQGSISTTSSTTNNNNNNNNSNPYQYQHQLQQNPHQRHYGAVKSAIIKTPIARARAREAKGSRKVIFGDIITIVTIERSETPPPPVSNPGSDKDKKKKAAAAAKKKAKKGGDKSGPHPDPEYDEEYYNQPYTPVPADVLITQAPWIGNPNYDEEKQNSKFYYEDDAIEYEYDDYEYEAPFDIRSGPGDEDDEDDGEEDEDEEDEDSVRGHAWGNGIAGGGATGVGKKKGGGMFKFKKAVNRLLRN
ncbi:hypothetical protein BGZ47_000022 [Haplosporangium gracile]|nr:hypothetical protein BGZ47_000022 [Haplosporangium gracile]